MLSLVGRLDGLGADLRRHVQGLLGDLLDALAGPVLHRADAEIRTNGSSASAGFAQPLDGQVGDADGGVDGGGVSDGLADLLDEGHGFFSFWVISGWAGVPGFCAGLGARGALAGLVVLVDFDADDLPAAGSPTKDS